MLHCFSSCVVPLFVEVVCFGAEAYDCGLAVVADAADCVDDCFPLVHGVVVDFVVLETGEGAFVWVGEEPSVYESAVGFPVCEFSQESGLYASDDADKGVADGEGVGV